MLGAGGGWNGPGAGRTVSPPPHHVSGRPRTASPSDLGSDVGKPAAGSLTRWNATLPGGAAAFPGRPRKLDADDKSHPFSPTEARKLVEHADRVVPRVNPARS